MPAFLLPRFPYNGYKESSGSHPIASTTEQLACALSFLKLQNSGEEFWLFSYESGLHPLMSQLYPREWYVIMVSALGKCLFPGESVVANRVGSVQSWQLLFKSRGFSGEEACIRNTFTRGKALVLGRWKNLRYSRGLWPSKAHPCLKMLTDMQVFTFHG